MRTKFSHSTRLLTAVAALATLAGAARAQTDATWLATTSDLWSSTTAWDINPLFPNNAGPTYNALIGPGIAGTSNFIVTLDQNITIENMQLTQSFTTLDLTSNTLTLNQNLTINQALVTSTPIPGGGLLDVHGNASLTRSRFIGASLRTAASSVVIINSGAGLEDFICDTDVDHSGRLRLLSDGMLTLDNGTTISMQPGSTFEIESANAQIVGMGTPSSIINNGTIMQSVPGANATVTGVSITNSGTIDISEGTFSTDGVSVPGGVLGEGTWRVSNGASLDLQGVAITTNAATIELDGVGTTFAALSGLTTNDAAGMLSVTGGSDFTTAGDFTNDGTLRVGDSTEFAVAPGFTLTNAAMGTLAGGTYDIAGTLRFDGADISTLDTTVSLSGPGAAILDDLGQNALRNLAMIDNAGDLTLAAGADLFISTDLTVGTTGRLEVDVGSTFEVDQNFTITNFSGGTFTGGVFDVRGTVVFNASVETLEGDFTLDGPTAMLVRPAGVGGGDVFAPLNTINTAGALTIRNGRDLTVMGDLTSDGALTVEDGPPDLPSTLTVPLNFTQTGGTVNLIAGGTINVGAGGAGNYLLMGGTLLGAGNVVGNIIQTGGSIEPGESAGTLSLDGDWTVDVGAGVKIQLGGTGVGEADLIDMTGDLVFGTPMPGLAGTLELSFINGYVPSIAGDTFEIIRAASRDGEFLTVIGPMNGGTPLYDVFYTGTSVWVTVYAVPTPPAAALLAGAGLLAMRRRRV